jgi:hypothetical protein
MRFLRLVGFCVMLVGAISLLPQAGSVVEANRVGFCDETCTTSSPCNQACLDPEGQQGIMSCGQWGVCEPPPCNPSWYPADADLIGGFAITWANTCDYYTTWDVTWADANNCPGASPPARCQVAYEYSDSPNYECCLYSWCGGQQGC